MVDAGRLTAEDAERIRSKNQKYAPFFRFLEDLEGDAEIATGAASASIKKIHRGLSEDGKVERPLSALVMKAKEVARFVESENVKKAIVLESRKAADALGIEEVKPTAVDSGDGTLLLPPQGKDIFTVWEDGKKRYYRADKDIVRSIEGADPPAISALLNLAQEMTWLVRKPVEAIFDAHRVAARTLRAGAVYAPQFMARKPFRDQMSAAVFSKHGYTPFLDLARGIGHVVSGSQTHRDYRASGAAMSSMAANDRLATEAQLADALIGDKTAVDKLKLFWKRYGREVKEAPSQALLFPARELSGLFEEGTRVGAFAKARKAGASMADAMDEAREVTLDFGRAGLVGRTWNGIEAFANAELQDLSKFTRAMAERPAETTRKALQWITLPAVANWLANRDNEDYQRLPLWDRAAFYHFYQFESGTFLRLPRPLGAVSLVFGLSAEQALEAVASGRGEEAARAAAESLLKHTPAHYVARIEEGELKPFSFDLLPNLEQPMAEVTSNYDSFSGRQIRPLGQENRLDGYQSYPTTSPMLQEIGQATGTSPLDLQHLARGYGGTLGRYGVAAGDELMRQVGLADRSQEVAKTPAEHPLWGAFLSPRPTGTRAQSTQDFFELLGRSNKARTTIEDLIEEGDLDAARRLAGQYPEFASYPDLSAIQRQISELIQARKIVQGSRELTPDEKREKIDRLNDLLRDLAERGIQVSR